MASGLLVYDDSIDTNGIHQVLFIDSTECVFQNYANTNTFPIIYDRTCTRDQMLEVLSKKFTTISRIAFVSHFSEKPWFLTEEERLNTESLDVSSSEFLFSAANTQFVINLIKQFQVSNVDYLACNTLTNPAWTAYYSLLLSANTGVTIGASDNNTGNIKYSDDWIRETTHEDVHTIYFNDLLLQNYT